MSLEGAQWRIVGFHDGYLGRSADTTIIPNEYRGDYLTGWYAGQQRARDEDLIAPPELVNGTRGEK